MDVYKESDIDEKRERILTNVNVVKKPTLQRERYSVDVDSVDFEEMTSDLPHILENIANDQRREEMYQILCNYFEVAKAIDLKLFYHPDFIAKLTEIIRNRSSLSRVGLRILANLWNAIDQDEEMMFQSEELIDGVLYYAKNNDRVRTPLAFMALRNLSSGYQKARQFLIDSGILEYLVKYVRCYLSSYQVRSGLGLMINLLHDGPELVWNAMVRADIVVLCIPMLKVNLRNQQLYNRELASMILIQLIQIPEALDACIQMEVLEAVASSIIEFTDSYNPELWDLIYEFIRKGAQGPFSDPTFAAAVAAVIEKDIERDLGSLFYALLALSESHLREMHEAGLFRSAARAAMEGTVRGKQSAAAFVAVGILSGGSEIREDIISHGGLDALLDNVGSISDPDCLCVILEALAELIRLFKDDFIGVYNERNLLDILDGLEDLTTESKGHVEFLLASIEE